MMIWRIPRNDFTLRFGANNGIVANETCYAHRLGVCQMDHDIVIVRAGACNICPLNRMRGLVINVTVIETGKEPGGTWFCAASVHWGC